MAESPIRVLLVDDEDSLRQPLAGWLTREYGYEVTAAADGIEAITLLTQQPCFDVALLDYLLPPPFNGLSLMEEIKLRCTEAGTAFIIFTGWGLDAQIGVSALKAGAYRYLSKPFDREELAILIQSVVETRRTREKLASTSREKAWLASLLEVSQIINSTLELDRVLDLILDTMKHVVVYDSASVQRMTPQGLEIVACRGFPHPERLIGRIFPLSDTFPNTQVWQNRRPQIVPDMQTLYPSHQVRGWLGVPLIHRGEAVGVITLDSQTPGFYNKEDADIAMAFANQAAAALENARLYEREFRRAETMRALLAVEQELTRNITTHSKLLLDKIAHTACQMTGADCAVIYPYVAEWGKYDLVNLAAYGLYGELTHQEKNRLAEGGGVSSWVLREGRVIITDAAHDDPRLLQHNFIKREQIEAFVGFRLDANEPVGILFVNFRQPHLWTQEELSLIEIFASQAAVAILNARLYGRTSEQLEQKVAELHTVGEINQRITATLDLNELLPLILNKAMELVGVQNGALQMVDETAGELFIRLSIGPMVVPLNQTRLQLGEGITGKAVQEKRTQLVADVTQSPWGHIYREFRPDTRAELAVPLLFGEVCIGVLNFEHSEPGYFKEAQREIIEALAAQAAIAIQNAQRYEELERTKGHLVATEAVAWIGLFGSSWAHSVAQKTAAARNYLAVLKDYVVPKQETQELLQKIEAVLRAIQGIPIVQQLPPKPRMSTIVDIDVTLTEQVGRWCRATPHVELTLDLHCAGLRAHIDKEWLNVAMEKLVNNALKAMPQGGALNITSTPRPDRVEVTITDSGYGLSNHVRPFFLKQQIPTEYTSGSGIGVLIARYIFRTFGGELELLWSEPQRGTTLRVILPASPVSERHNGGPD
jgi:GAF domain-containing protein/CheY-like chemotaxis protein